MVFQWINQLIEKFFSQSLKCFENLTNSFQITLAQILQSCSQNFDSLQFQQLVQTQNFQKCFDMINRYHKQMVGQQSLIQLFSTLNKPEHQRSGLTNEFFNAIYTSQYHLVGKAFIKCLFSTLDLNYKSQSIERGVCLIKEKYERDEANRNTQLDCSVGLISHSINRKYLKFLLKYDRIDQALVLFEQYLKFINNSCFTEKNFKFFQIYTKGIIQKSTSSPLIKGKFEFSQKFFLRYFTGMFNYLQKCEKKPKEMFFNKLIDYSSKNGVLSFAQILHDSMESFGLQPSTITYNSLIDTYFKNNDPVKAQKYYETLKQNGSQDNFTFSIMINGLQTAANDFSSVKRIFDDYVQLQQTLTLEPSISQISIEKDCTVLNTMLDASIFFNKFEQGLQIMEEIRKKYQVNLDLVSYNTLLQGCAKCRQLEKAEAFFDELMSKTGNEMKPNLITYNSLIDCAVKVDQISKVWEILDLMREKMVEPDSFTYSILFNGIKPSAHCSKDDLYRAINLLVRYCGEQTKNKIAIDDVLYNSLIDACVGMDEMERALELFEQMQRDSIKPTSITYGILIKAFGKKNDLQRAFQVFECMRNNGVHISEVTYGTLIQACVQNGNLNLGLRVAEQMKKNGIEMNSFHCCSILRGLSKMKQYSDAYDLMEDIRKNSHDQANLIVYNTIIDIAVRDENEIQIDFYFNDMITRKLVPDLITVSTIMKMYTKVWNFSKIRFYLSKIEEYKIIPDDSLMSNILESGFTNRKSHEGIEIFEIFQKQYQQTISNQSYSAAVKLYGGAHKNKSAVQLYERLKNMNFPMNSVFYANLIGIHFNDKKYELGIKFYQEMVSLQVEGIDFSQKFQFILSSFFSLLTRLVDHHCYTQLINGCINNNQIPEAFEFLVQSLDKQITLNHELYQQLLTLNHENKNIQNSESIEQKLILCINEKQKEHQLTDEQSTVATRINMTVGSERQKSQNEQSEINNESFRIPHKPLNSHQEFIKKMPMINQAYEQSTCRQEKQENYQKIGEGDKENQANFNNSNNNNYIGNGLNKNNANIRRSIIKTDDKTTLSNQTENNKFNNFVNQTSQNTVIARKSINKSETSNLKLL